MILDNNTSKTKKSLLIRNQSNTNACGTQYVKKTKKRSTRKVSRRPWWLFFFESCKKRKTFRAKYFYCDDIKNHGLQTSTLSDIVHRFSCENQRNICKKNVSPPKNRNFAFLARFSHIECHPRSLKLCIKFQSIISWTWIIDFSTGIWR